MSLFQQIFSEGDQKKARILIAILLGFGTLFVFSQWVVPGFMDWWEQLRGARAPSVERNKGEGVVSTQIFSWVGKITRVEGDGIVIADAAHPERTEKKAEISAATRITKLAFSPITLKGVKRFMPEETSVDSKALKVGVHVEAMAPVNIAERDSFPSVHIRVLP